MFFAGKIARVTSVHEDVDGDQHVGVVVEDDPAADLHEWYGRYLYFAPDEVEPLEPKGVRHGSSRLARPPVIAWRSWCCGAVVVGVRSLPDAAAIPEDAADVADRSAITSRILVAGIGNIFLGDDGFGPEVMRHVRRTRSPTRLCG